MTDAALAEEQPLFITIERNFKHPVETVFKAWTHTEALRQWMGPQGYSCDDAQMEAKVGGCYVFPMKSPEGDVHTVRGVISEIEENKSLRFSWVWDQEDGSDGHEMEVDLKFHPTPNGTRLVITHSRFASEDVRDRHNEGWDSCLASLMEYLG